MQDEDPQASARTMNAWMHEYVSVAQQLKRQNVVEYLRILSGQLGTAEKSLHDAENALEAFRVHTITLPQESSPIAGGVQMSSDPAIKNYFTQKFDFDQLKHDREALERITPNPADSVSVEAALLIPSVSQSPERPGASRGLRATEQGAGRFGGRATGRSRINIRRFAI